MIEPIEHHISSNPNPNSKKRNNKRVAIEQHNGNTQPELAQNVVSGLQEIQARERLK